jgi:hypothetical protein
MADRQKPSGTCQHTAGRQGQQAGTKLTWQPDSTATGVSAIRSGQNKHAAACIEVDVLCCCALCGAHRVLAVVRIPHA